MTITEQSPTDRHAALIAEIKRRIKSGAVFPPTLDSCTIFAHRALLEIAERHAPEVYDPRSTHYHCKHCTETCGGLFVAWPCVDFLTIERARLRDEAERRGL